MVVCTKEARLYICRQCRGLSDFYSIISNSGLVTRRRGVLGYIAVIRWRPRKLLMESGVDFIAGEFAQANRLTIHILAAVAV